MYWAKSWSLKIPVFMEHGASELFSGVWSNMFLDSRLAELFHKLHHFFGWLRIINPESVQLLFVRWNMIIVSVAVRIVTRQSVLHLIDGDSLRCCRSKSEEKDWDYHKVHFEVYFACSSCLVVCWGMEIAFCFYSRNIIRCYTKRWSTFERAL